MNNWIPKNKTVRFAIATAVFSIVLYFVGFAIVLSKIKKVESIYLEAGKESAKEQKLLTIKSISANNADTIQTLRNFYVQKGDEVQFIEKIEKIAVSSSLKFEILSIDVKAIQDDSSKEDINVKMNFEGAWRDMIVFIDKLEKMLFGVSIEKVSLSANTVGLWSGLIEFTLFREK